MKRKLTEHLEPETLQKVGTLFLFETYVLTGFTC